MQKITADVFFRRAAATRLSIPTKRMLNPPEGADGEPRRVGRVGDEVESPSLLRRSRTKITA